MYPPAREGSARYRFDAFEADAGSGELLGGGAKILIQEIPFRFLIALLKHPGEVQGREDLRKAIWPEDVNLDFDGALATAARKVRQALGDSIRESRFIETLPGRGYRFIGQVALVAGDAGSAVAPHTPLRQAGIGLLHRVAGLLLVAMGSATVLAWKPAGATLPGPASPRAPCVVALPARVFGGADLEFYTDAIPDTLSTLLAKEEGLDTKLPPSSTQMEKIQGDLARIAAAYGADFLILTTVTAEGERLLLNVKLAEAASQKVRWASQYEGAQGDYHGLLRRVAQALAAVVKPAGGPRLAHPAAELSLREAELFQGRFGSSRDPHDYQLALAAFHKALALEPSNPLLLREIAVLEQQRLGAPGAPAPDPSNPAATDRSQRPDSPDSRADLAIQEGRYYLRKYFNHKRVVDYARARASFDRAILASPGSPEVMAWIADSYWNKLMTDGDSPAIAKVDTWARRALERDPRCGKAWALLAQLESFRERTDLDAAIENSLKGIRCAPGDPLTHRALGGAAPGPLFMVACGWKSWSMDPLDDLDPGMLATGLIWMGRPAEALPVLDRALAQNPESVFLVPTKAMALARLGRSGEAMALLDSCRPQPSDRTNFPLDFWNQARFVCVARHEDAASARRLGKRLMQRYLDPRTDNVSVLNGMITMAPELMMLGMGEETLSFFERSLRSGPAPGLEWLASTPELRPLHGNPRFRKVLAQSRSEAGVIVRHLEQAKAAGELPSYLEQPLAELRGLVARPL